MDITAKRWAVLGLGVTLAIGFAGLGFAAMSTNPPFAIPEWLPIVLFILAGISLFATAIYLFIIRKRKTSRRKKSKKQAIETKPQIPKTDYTKLDTVSKEEKDLIGHIGFRMMDTHGHSDLMGMVSDRANGVEINDLMSKPCHVCGYIRNQRNKRK